MAPTILSVLSGYTKVLVLLTTRLVDTKMQMGHWGVLGDLRVPVRHHGAGKTLGCCWDNRW